MGARQIGVPEARFMEAIFIMDRTYGAPESVRIPVAGLKPGAMSCTMATPFHLRVLKQLMFDKRHLTSSKSCLSISNANGGLENK
jgi:hypothetical protein